MNIRITLLIPILLVFSTLAATFLVFTETKRAAVQGIKEDALQRLKLDITRLQNILYNLLTEKADNLEDAKLNLSVTAMDTQIHRLLLVDEKNIVLLANRYLLEGSPASKVANFETKYANKVRGNKNPEFFFHPYQRSTLLGYFPVVLKLENKQGLPVKRMGILYAELNLQTRLKRAYDRAAIQSLGFGILLLGASLIVAIMLHLLISRRLGYLTQAARHLAAGDLETRVALGGNDELTVVGSAFNEMAIRIKQDIRKRQMAELQLRELNETLERRIAKGTAQLEQKKQELLDNQTIAFHNNKLIALGEMASGIAHEINSPLQAISLFAYRIKKSALISDCGAVNDASHQIDNAVQKISDIVESLRNMSRDSSHEPFELVILKDILKDVTGITTERYRLHGIKFSWVFEDDCDSLEIKCQRIRIGQVLMNLLNNAYDAVHGMDEKWISINIKVSEGLIKFTVTDSGKGIPELDCSKIFEPMFTTKEVGKGTGLGLSISSEIARQHGGSLYLDKESENTRFVLQIPIQNPI